MSGEDQTPPSEEQIAPPEKQSGVSRFVSNNKGGMVGLLLSIVGMVLGGPVGGLIAGVIGMLLGSVVGDKGNGIIGQALSGITNSIEKNRADGASVNPKIEQGVGTAEEQSAAMAALGHADTALLTGWAANTTAGRWLLTRTVGTKGAYGAAKWGATSAAPAVAGATIAGGTAAITTAGAVGTAPIGAALGTATTSIAGASGAAATTGAVIGAVAVPAAVVVAAAGTAYMGYKAVDIATDTAALYESIDKTFQPDHRHHRNIIGAQAMLNSRMESHGGIADENGRFSLLLPENQLALRNAIRERKADLKDKMEANETLFTSRYLFWRKSTGDKRNAYESAKVDLRQINSAQAELDGYIANIKEQAGDVVRQHIKTKDLASSADVNREITDAQEAADISAPSTPLASNTQKDKNAAPLGADGLPINQDGGAELT